MRNRQWLALAVISACWPVACSDGDTTPDASQLQAADAARDAGSPVDPPPPDAADAVWSHMGYDPRNHYCNPNESRLSVDNAAEIELLWTFEVDGFPPGTPAIAEGKVFVLATGGLYAIELESGREAWSNAEMAGTASVAYADGFVYVHTAPADLYKLNAEDGSVVWGPVRTFDAPRADGTSSPVIAGDKVIVGRSTSSEIFTEGREDAVGGVSAYAIEDGERAWVYETVALPENGAMVWSTVGVDVDRGVVYATTGNNYTVAGPSSDAFHAIDLETGTRLWVSQVREGDVWSIIDPPVGDTDFGANPIVAEVDGQHVIAAGDKAAAFWALDENGEVLWSRTDLSERQTMSTGGILNNGAFDGRYFYAIVNEPDPGATTWTGHSLLYKFDPMNRGADAWEPKRIEKIVWGMPTLANGLLLLPADDELLIYDAERGEELNRFNTGGTIAAGGAAVAGGRIVVQSGLQYPFGVVTNNNQVHCYGLRD